MDGPWFLLNFLCHQTPLSKYLPCMRWWKLKFNLRSLHCRSSLGCSPQPLSRRLPATQHAHFIGQDGRNERRSEREEGIQEMAKSKLRKKVSPSSAAHPLVRPLLSFFARPRPRDRAPLLVNSFPNVQIPRLSVVLEFFQVRVERGKEGGKEEKKSISAATPPSLPIPLYPSIGSCYAAVTAAAADRRGRTDVGTDGRAEAATSSSAHPR